MSSLFSSSWFWQHPFTKAPSSIHAKGRGHQHWHTGEYQISTSNRYLESKVDEISSQSLSLQYVAVLILGMKLPSPPDMIMITVMMTRWNGQTSTTPTCIAVAWKLQRLPALNKTLLSFGEIRFWFVLLWFALFCFEQNIVELWGDQVSLCRSFTTWSRWGWLLLHTGTLQWELWSEDGCPDGGRDSGHDQQ